MRTMARDKELDELFSHSFGPGDWRLSWQTALSHISLESGVIDKSQAVGSHGWGQTSKTVESHVLEDCFSGRFVPFSRNIRLRIVFMEDVEVVGVLVEGNAWCESIEVACAESRKVHTARMHSPSINSFKSYKFLMAPPFVTRGIVIRESEHRLMTLRRFTVAVRFHHPGSLIPAPQLTEDIASIARLPELMDIVSLLP